jgi:putative flippase GtrA
VRDETTSLQQFVRFAFIGALGFVVDLGVLYGAIALGAGYLFGRGLSFTAAVFFTWQCNRRFTFRSGPESYWIEGTRYFLAMALGGVTNLAVYGSIVTFFPKNPWLPFYGVALGSIAGMVINFVGAKFWVFGAKRAAHERCRER